MLTFEGYIDDSISKFIIKHKKSGYKVTKIVKNEDFKSKFLEIKLYRYGVTPINVKEVLLIKIIKIRITKENKVKYSDIQTYIDNILVSIEVFKNKGREKI